MTITKENLEYISIDEKTGDIVFKIDTKGNVGAINKIEGKIQISKTYISDYRPPQIEWDQDYNEAF